jgi:hypothetical protein
MRRHYGQMVKIDIVLVAIGEAEIGSIGLVMVVGILKVNIVVVYIMAMVMDVVVMAE